MLKPKIYTVNPYSVNHSNFSPRNYDPIFLVLKEKLEKYNQISSILEKKVTSGDTPKAWFFRDRSNGIPFVKTSAIKTDFINMNNLHFISPKIHKSKYERSITKSFDVIFSMTGKFMGKAALCPPNMELNMSQNSVNLRCKTTEEAAFLCIYLNSVIKTLSSGLYSITKQKYLNQTRISNINIPPYQNSYSKDISKYIINIKRYYASIEKINSIIRDFDKLLNIEDHILTSKISFTVPFEKIDKVIFTPRRYRPDIDSKLDNIITTKTDFGLEKMEKFKGIEVGSSNYVSEGIPFVKTSDFLNYDVDYQSDHYCSEATYEEYGQNLEKGDILFTKDGRIGEVGILLQSAKILISGGIVVLKPESDYDRYWMFLLLASNYGKCYLYKWTVIGSTMAHLRRNLFYNEFKDPRIDESLKSTFINELQKSFKEKSIAFNEIQNAKQNITSHLYKEIDNVV